MYVLFPSNYVYLYISTFEPYVRSFFSFYSFAVAQYSASMHTELKPQPFYRFFSFICINISICVLHHQFNAVWTFTVDTFCLYTLFSLISWWLWFFKFWIPRGTSKRSEKQNLCQMLLAKQNSCTTSSSKQLEMQKALENFQRHRVCWNLW